MPWFCTINSCLQKIIIFLKYHAVQKILNLREEYVVHITERSPPGDYFAHFASHNICHNKAFYLLIV